MKRFNLYHVKPVAKPVVPNTVYNDDESGVVVDVKVVREELGTLLWIANSTRPDIAYAVNFVSRYREKPRECYWLLIKRIFRYLKGSTSMYGLLYVKGSQAVAPQNWKWQC